MRLFLMLVVLLMVQYKTFGQEILIKEDFEFYWPLQQYDIQGDWDLFYPTYSTGSSMTVYSRVGRSRSLKDFSSWNFPSFIEFDSVYIEVTSFGTSAGSVSDNILNDKFVYSSDSLVWQFADYCTGRNYCMVDTQTYPFIKLNGGGYLDNLLVIGYTDTEISNCQYDANQDGMVNAPDLIDFLSWYGTTTVCD